MNCDPFVCVLVKVVGLCSRAPVLCPCNGITHKIIMIKRENANQMPARQASDKSQCCSLPPSASAWGGGRIGRPQMNEIHQSLTDLASSLSQAGGGLGDSLWMIL